MIKNVDKSKLVLIHNRDELIMDQPLEGKEVGYYKDSWNRFRKNKASVVAFYIIVFILFFVLVGPYLKRYNLPQTSHNEALRLKNLPPKVPGLEKLGIFDGTKKIRLGKRFLNYVANDPNGEGLIISGFPEELVADVNHPDYATVTEFDVKVDYYKYANYISSHLPDSYFGTLDSNERGGTNIDPLGPVKRTLSSAQFQDAVEKKYIVEVLRVIESEDGTGAKFYQYEVKVDQFKYALNQTPDDTYFWFGTNAQGKDLFTEIWKGARISLLMAISVLLINTMVGLTLGSIVGYYGGVVDLIFDRFVEIVSSIPFLSVLTLLTLRYGSALWVIVLAFTATGWIGAYGTGRMQFYRFKNREYVLAARTLGASDPRIMFKHIFPNTLGYIVTGYALSIPAFIFTEATYSFLNSINYSKTTSVGMLLREGQATMNIYPHLLIFPAIYIATLMIAFNLFGNGLRDAFNPSLRGAE